MPFTDTLGGFALFKVSSGRRKSVMGNLGGRMTTYLKPVVTGFLLCSFMAVMISISFAQATTGTITGIVVDQTGAVIVGASITARNIDTNITRTSQTGEVGRYSMPA